MSSKAKKIEEQVKTKAKLDRFDCENTLLGTVVLSLGKLKNIPETKLIEDFLEITKDYENWLKENGFSEKSSIKDLVVFFCRKYEVEEGKEFLIMIYDSEQQYTPMCTLLVNDNILPVAEDGSYSGILLAALTSKSDRFEIEYIFR